MTDTSAKLHSADRYRLRTFGTLALAGPEDDDAANATPPLPDITAMTCFMPFCSAMPRIFMPGAPAVALLGALLTASWGDADTADARTRREASGLVSAYAEYHLDRRLRSLAMVDR